MSHDKALRILYYYASVTRLRICDTGTWRVTNWITITGSIAPSANCRYLIYPEADFEGFRAKPLMLSTVERKEKREGE